MIDGMCLKEGLDDETLIAIGVSLPVHRRKLQTACTALFPVNPALGDDKEDSKPATHQQPSDIPVAASAQSASDSDGDSEGVHEEEEAEDDNGVGLFD